MRTRHSTGGVRKQRGRWIGMWYADGKRKSKVVGFVRDMTKGKAREEVAKIVAGAAKGGTSGTVRWSSSRKFIFRITAGSGKTRRGKPT